MDLVGEDYELRFMVRSDKFDTNSYVGHIGDITALVHITRSKKDGPDTFYLLVDLGTGPANPPRGWDDLRFVKGQTDEQWKAQVDIIVHQLFSEVSDNYAALFKRVLLEIAKKQ